MRLAMLALLLPLFASAGPLPRTPAPTGAKLYFISPADGAKLKSPLTVRFGLAGMGVAPAGIVQEATGHHHLLVDVETLPPMDLPIPNDARHRHFGGGQTEVTIELPPGRHTLQLLLGDANHIPHHPPVISEPITVEVE
ncbi:MAG: DUF4399 domain-containing protein [Xanthomonadales bacterium PRO6]|nr:hypothetical protein [Xanthomonadales bacterium]MCE7932928.1 DUF4399 domain-containing protein [Xanthomonadales bacterium PRO6]